MVSQMQKQPIYLKAITLRDISDLDIIKQDAKKQMILIIRVTPMAHRNIEALRKVIDDLYSYVKSYRGRHRKAWRRTCNYYTALSKDMEGHL